MTSQSSSPRIVPRPRRALLLMAILALTLFAVSPVSARMQLKMATLVPDGSIWDKVLREMGADFQKATGGEVGLRIYAGGVAGDEPDVVRKMRLGQLHAAAITVSGLSDIVDGFEIFEIPMFYESYDELFHVLEKLRPELEKRLAAKGFVLLHWGHGGWIHLFSKQPVRTVEDLRQQKLFAWAGDDAMVQLWRSRGFKPVPLAATDILTGLQTGMVDVIPTTPLAALSLQWFRQTPYMQDLGLAPLVGATVITERAWKRISPENQSKLRKVAARYEARLAKEIPAQDARAVTQMTERGLEVVNVTPDVGADWRNAAAEFTAERRKAMGEPELLEQAIAARDAFREKASKGSGGADVGSGS